MGLRVGGCAGEIVHRTAQLDEFDLHHNNLDGTVSNKTYTFNTALVSDKDLNSDGDNLVNEMIQRPIYTPESVG